MGHTIKRCKEPIAAEQNGADGGFGGPEDGGGFDAPPVSNGSVGGWETAPVAPVATNGGGWDTSHDSSGAW